MKRNQNFDHGCQPEGCERHYCMDCQGGREGFDTVCAVANEFYAVLVANRNRLQLHCRTCFRSRCLKIMEK